MSQWCRGWRRSIAVCDLLEECHEAAEVGDVVGGGEGFDGLCVFLKGFD